MEYNAQQNGEEDFFSPDASLAFYCRIDVYGPSEEDVCVYGTGPFLTEELGPDLVVFVRRGLTNQQVVERMLAGTIRVDENGLA